MITTTGTAARLMHCNGTLSNMPPRREIHLVRFIDWPKCICPLRIDPLCIDRMKTCPIYSVSTLAGVAQW